MRPFCRTDQGHKIRFKTVPYSELLVLSVLQDDKIHTRLIKIHFIPFS